MTSWQHHGAPAAWRLAQIMWHYRLARSANVPYQPYRLWIEPTALCNLQCRYCPNKTLSRQQKLGYMPFELFTHVVDQAVGYAHDVNLMHRGESLLHPRFVDMVHYAGGRGLFTKLHTNASLLDAEMADALLDAPLGLLSFSFDGYDAETYEYFRVGAHFEQARENILRFLEKKRARGQDGPLTVLEVMDLPDRAGAFASDRQARFLEQFAGLPLDKVIVKKPHNWAGSVRLPDQSAPVARSACTFLWHSLVVLWDGTVGPCPHDYFARIVLGDAREENLTAIFHGERLTALRQAMLEGAFDSLDPCADCSTLRRDTVMGIPRQSLKFLRW